MHRSVKVLAGIESGKLPPERFGPTKYSLHEIPSPQTYPQLMDIFWSIGVVPIGILLCFSPALIAYWLTEGKNAISNEPAPQPAKASKPAANQKRK